MSSPACVPATSTQPLYRKLATSLGPCGELASSPLPDPNPMASSEALWAHWTRTLCQMKCGKKCQKIYQLRCQWKCQSKCQNTCQITCWIECRNIYIYISADPACSRGSASEEELPAARAKKSLQAARARSKKTRKKKQEAITGNKRQEARNKKPGSNKRLEDRSES